MNVPHGLEEICEVYGDPRPLLADGIMAPPEVAEWESRLVLVNLPAPIPISFAPTKSATRIKVHKAAAAAFESVFRTLYAERDLWDEVKTYGGSYCFRTKRASGGELSAHAWGIAIDLNVKGNEMGETPTMHPGIVQVFKAHEFTWGGRWRRPDGMHFQLASGY